MKKYLIKLQNEDDFNYLIQASQFPKRSDYAEVIQAPSDAEYAQDYDVVDQENEIGELVKVVQLNQSKKDARIAAELATNIEVQWTQMRNQRNKLLLESDFTQLIDSPLTEEERDLWVIYRQELRDLPENILDIENIEWPIKPE